MRPLVAGSVSVDLNCTITHRSLPLVLCVRATAAVSNFHDCSIRVYCSDCCIKVFL